MQIWMIPKLNPKLDQNRSKANPKLCPFSTLSYFRQWLKVLTIHFFPVLRVGVAHLHPHPHPHQPQVGVL